ncbi:MAG: hypothetical protein FWB72_03305, partial [Firmicutes bacterium]|nr:hypothetical protein [Bacillota bacterium]
MGKNYLKVKSKQVNKQRGFFALLALFFITVCLLTSFSVTLLFDRGFRDRVFADSRFFSSATDPIWITNYRQLMNIGNELALCSDFCDYADSGSGKFLLKDGHYRLADNIVIPGGLWQPFSNNLTAGHLNGAFSGVLDGRGFSISFEQNALVTTAGGNWGIVGASDDGAFFVNLDIYLPYSTTIRRTTAANNTGVLVGTAARSRIQNVSLRGEGRLEALAAANNLGGLIGALHTTSLGLNLSSTINVIAPNKDSVGGLAGVADLIMYSFASGDVIGRHNVGGLIGGAANVEDSFATGNVTGRTTVGGLVGRITTSASAINRSFASGNVTAEGNYVGGLIGWGAGNTRDTFATGNVYSLGNNVGGLIGSGLAMRSWASGNVTGASNVGGFSGLAQGIGSNNAAFGNVVSTGSSNDPTNPGGLAGGFIGNLDNAGQNTMGTVLNNLVTGSVTNTATSGYVALGGYAGRQGLRQNNSTVRDPYTNELIQVVNRGAVLLGNHVIATNEISATNGATAFIGSLLGRQDSAIFGINGGTFISNQLDMHYVGVHLENIVYTSGIALASLRAYWDLGYTSVFTNAGLVSRGNCEIFTLDGTAYLGSTAFTGFTSENWVFNRQHFNKHVPYWINFPVPNAELPRTTEYGLAGREHIITTAYQLANIGSGRPLGEDGARFGVFDIYVLGSDIVVTAGYMPALRSAGVGTAFGGILNGNSYRIIIEGEVLGVGNVFGIIGYANAAVVHDLTIYLPFGSRFGSNGNYVGLLAGRFVSGNVSRVDVIGGGEVFGNAIVGGIAGFVNGGLYRQLLTTVNVRGQAHNVGGMFGHMLHFTLRDSFAFGNVYTAGIRAGGVFGYASNPVIERVAAFGNVTGSNLVGGFGGIASHAIQINNSAAYGSVTVTGSSTSPINANINGGIAGGFLGAVDRSAPIIRYSFAFGNLYSEASSGYVALGGFVGVVRGYLTLTSVASLSDNFASNGANVTVGSLIGLTTHTAPAANSTAQFTGTLAFTAGRTTLVNGEIQPIGLASQFLNIVNVENIQSVDVGQLLAEGGLQEMLEHMLWDFRSNVGVWVKDKSECIFWLAGEFADSNRDKGRYVGLPMLKGMHPNYANRVNFHFNASGGFFGGGAENVMRLSQRIRTPRVIAPSVMPEREGYKFIGWADSGGNIIFDANGTFLDNRELLALAFISPARTIFAFYALWEFIAIIQPEPPCEPYEPYYPCEP